MTRRVLSLGTLWASAVLLLALCGPSAVAAPRISNLSLRGVQAGGVTTVVIEGKELIPEPRLLLSAPIAKLTIKEGATAERLEAEITIDPKVPAGIYALRVASTSGVSDMVPLAIDHLAQIPFAPALADLNVALSGALNGSTVLSTTFNGKAGQNVVIEVESHRLGAKLDPVVHVYDARRAQIAWSPALATLAGDARCVATLPADGIYTIELHDALFRGKNPGHFRMKVGEFRYADLVFPLAVQQGVNTSFQYARTNLPADAQAAASWTKADAPPEWFEPAPWPADLPRISGSRPRVLISSHAELVEAPAADKPQEIAAPPIGINGRIAAAGEQDRYRLAVTPGQSLRIEVWARRAGSPLDGVLSIQNEQGGELAASDDQPGTTDPGLDFKVPDNVSAVLLVLRDLEGCGGSDYLYRISVEPLGRPSFSLTVDEDQLLIPRDGAALARVRAVRNGYNGPIKLSFPHLPVSVSLTGDEIPAGATQALVTLSAPGLAPAQTLTTITGRGDDAGTALIRAVRPPSSTASTFQPWLGQDVGVAVTPAGPLTLVWDLFSANAQLLSGTNLPIRVQIARAEGTKGAVRLNLLTTQVTPTKRVKVNNQDRDVEDLDRTLRFASAPMIAADQSEVSTAVIVPADLPQIAYDLAIEAQLLADDGKTVTASAVTPARRMTVGSPIAVQLNSQDPVEARAGLGPTGTIAGKIQRSAGFNLPVNVTLTGLPKGWNAPSVNVAGDQVDFALPVSFPFETPAGDVANVKLVATSQVDPKNAATLLRSGEVPVALKVVPGEKPPAEQPLAIFEDQAEFVAALTEGGGQATMHGDEKYSGAASVKVTPDQRFNPALPGLGLRIREKPGPGEFRYLQFAWKKQGGQAICLQLNHDGQWGPVGGQPAKFRYHAGPAGECYNASVGIDSNLPAAFTIVTRDLFADFGEFTLTGLALSPVDGEFALFDHIYLGKAPADFDLVKPEPAKP